MVFEVFQTFEMFQMLWMTMSSKLVFRHIKQKDTIAINIIILPLSYNWPSIDIGYGPFLWCTNIAQTIPDQFVTCKTAWKGAICAFINLIIVEVDCCFISLKAYSSHMMQCEHCILDMITFDCYHIKIWSNKNHIFVWNAQIASCLIWSL